MIATTIPELLHVCPGCDQTLASENLLCRICREAYEEYLRLVRDGVASEDVPQAVVLEELRAMAPRFEYPRGQPTELHRDVISYPDRGSRVLDFLWMLGAGIFAAGVLIAWEVAGKFLIEGVGERNG